MRKTVKFYKKGHAFFGSEVAEAGYVGDVDTIANAVTITVIKPNTVLEDVKRSLQITIQDIDLRIKQEKKVIMIPKVEEPESLEHQLAVELQKLGDNSMERFL